MGWRWFFAIVRKRRHNALSSSPARTREHPELKLRMGIHSGPINEVTDVNERANVAGAGIDIAQRVMDCGDAGHILLSKRAADDLAPYPRWNARLHDLGECEAKHGVLLHVVNLYTEELGNPEAPEKFKKAGSAKRAGAKRPKRPKNVGKSCRGRSAAAGCAALGRDHCRRLAPAWNRFLAVSLQISPDPAGREDGCFSIRAGAGPKRPGEKHRGVTVRKPEQKTKRNAYFADGIQDEILDALIEDRRSEGDLAHLDAALQERAGKSAARSPSQLGVANVVEGSVQKSQDQVRVNVQLINAADRRASLGGHLRSQADRHFHSRERDC